MSKTIVPEIKSLKLSDLVVDIGLSGRSEREIKENAKSLAGAISAAGGWDVTQPGAFFMRDDKPHLARGFTRHAACVISDVRDGYFVEIEDDPAKLRTEAIRSNMGKPISAYEQGKIYVQMRDGTNADEAKVGDVILAPMKMKEIAREVGYTEQHVSNCICIFESSPEIGELIQAGKVSAGIVVRSAQLVKDPAKQLRFLKAAIKKAAEEGKDCATMKHLDAVKADFAPVKPVKKNDTPAETAQDASDGEEGGDTENSESESTTTTDEQPELSSLGASQEAAKKSAPAPTPTKLTREILIPIISKWLDDTDTVASDDDVNELVARVLEAAAPF